MLSTLQQCLQQFQNSIGTHFEMNTIKKLLDKPHAYPLLSTMIANKILGCHTPQDGQT